MSRDHYKGIPKKRAALIGANGELEALQKGGDEKVIYGTVTLAAGTGTVNDSRIKATSGAMVSDQTGATPSWSLADGSLTISGTGNNVMVYQVIL